MPSITYCFSRCRCIFRALLSNTYVHISFHKFHAMYTIICARCWFIAPCLLFIMPCLCPYYVQSYPQFLDCCCILILLQSILFWPILHMLPLLDNLLLPFVNTTREGDVEKVPCCDTTAVVGAGAPWLTCSTVGTCNGRRRVNLVCYLVTVTTYALY